MLDFQYVLCFDLTFNALYSAIISMISIHFMEVGKKFTLGLWTGCAILVIHRYRFLCSQVSLPETRKPKFSLF